MSDLKKIINESIRSRMEEAKEKPLHSELKKLSSNTYYEGGGSSSVSTTRFRGPKNAFFGSIEKMITSRGYKKVIRERGNTEYHKDLQDGKQTAKVAVKHEGNHVYAVETLTYRNHY